MSKVEILFNNFNPKYKKQLIITMNYHSCKGNASMAPSVACVKT
jgi:hypothetical protein